VERASSDGLAVLVVVVVVVVGVAGAAAEGFERMKNC